MCFVPSSTLSTTDVSAPLYPNATSDSPSKYSAVANKAASALEFLEHRDLEVRLPERSAVGIHVDFKVEFGTRHEQRLLTRR